MRECERKWEREKESKRVNEKERESKWERERERERERLFQESFWSCWLHSIDIIKIWEPNNLIFMNILLFYFCIII